MIQNLVFDLYRIQVVGNLNVNWKPIKIERFLITRREIGIKLFTVWKSISMFSMLREKLMI